MNQDSMARVYYPAYGIRKVTLRRFALYFVIFEVVTWFGDSALHIYGMDSVWRMGLIIVPFFIFPWVLWASINPTDVTFESPIIWMAFALLGFAAFIVMVAIGLYALTKGSVGGAGYLFLGGLIVITFSIRAWTSARDRREEWRRMMMAQKMFCPLCRVRVRHSVGICQSCGAMVFWVPSWMDDQ